MIVLINIKFRYLITAILFGIALITIGVRRLTEGIIGHSAKIVHIEESKTQEKKT